MANRRRTTDTDPLGVGGRRDGLLRGNVLESPLHGAGQPSRGRSERHCDSGGRPVDREDQVALRQVVGWQWEAGRRQAAERLHAEVLTLASMPVLDPTTLSPEALTALAAEFDSLCGEDLQPFSQWGSDAIRARIDAAFDHALGLPSLDVVRGLLAREPVVGLIPLV